MDMSGKKPLVTLTGNEGDETLVIAGSAHDCGHLGPPLPISMEQFSIQRLVKWQCLAVTACTDGGGGEKGVRALEEGS